MGAVPATTFRKTTSPRDAVSKNCEAGNRHADVAAAGSVDVPGAVASPDAGVAAACSVEVAKIEESGMRKTLIPGSADSRAQHHRSQHHGPQQR